MFGTLYKKESDLADAILDAIAETPKMTQEAYEQKLYEISAENFSKSVYAFYLDFLISQKASVNKKSL